MLMNVSHLNQSTCMIALFAAHVGQLDKGALHGSLIGAFSTDVPYARQV